MSLIDDLKKKSAEGQQAGEEEADITERKQSLFGPIIQSRLTLVQKYFTELAETLNNLEPDERHEFKLTHGSTLKGLIQRDFSCYVEKDSAQKLKEVTFKNKLEGNNDFKINCSKPPEAELLKKILNDRGIQYQKKGDSRGGINFSIKPAIYTRFSFTPDFEKGSVILTIINYDGSWDQTLKFRPDKVNAELLDEIGKYALHKDNKLMDMTGNKLSMTMRERLQAKLKGPVKKKKMIIKKKTEATEPPKKKKGFGISGFFKKKSASE